MRKTQSPSPLIAELEFPERWPDLINVRYETDQTNLIDSFASHKQLVQSPGNNDMNIDLGLLETAHSIFREWRSDAFWLVLKLVHSNFLMPSFRLFVLTIKPLLATPDPLLARTIVIFIDLYCDLTCQELCP